MQAINEDLRQRDVSAVLNVQPVRQVSLMLVTHVQIPLLIPHHVCLQQDKALNMNNQEPQGPFLFFPWGISTNIILN
jgi:hypothetical protein